MPMASDIGIIDLMLAMIGLGNSEMPDVPLRDDVWPRYLRENAMRVFKLDQ